MIGLLVPPDRWTCPSCRVTEVPQAPEAELSASIRRLQEQHARDHDAERQPNAGAIE